MTAQDFQRLSENDQKVALFEATKIAEKMEGSYKRELFGIDDFFVESTTCGEAKIRRTLTVYLNEQWDEVCMGYREKLA